MKRTLIAIAIAIVPATAIANPYVEYSLETSNSPVHADTELQNRVELGYGFDTPSDVAIDVYVYHESDPRNGFEGRGWPGETENGAGIGFRYEFGD